MNTVPLTMEQVLNLVNKGVNQGKYLTVIDLLLQFSSAAVNEVERLMQTTISKEDLEDLQSRLTAKERLVDDLVYSLNEFRKVYEGLCLIYGLEPAVSPAYVKAQSLINANKKEE